MFIGWTSTKVMFFVPIGNSRWPPSADIVLTWDPPYFKDQTVPLICYTYTKPIATKIFNHKRVLCDLSTDDFKSKPPDCSCSTSPFRYSPAGHVITGDLNIVANEKLRNILAKGPKYREPQPINWKYNFKLVMDSVEDYARQWARREKDEVDTLSEWVKSVRSSVLNRIRRLKGLWAPKLLPYLKTLKLRRCCLNFRTNTW